MLRLHARKNCEIKTEPGGIDALGLRWGGADEGSADSSSYVGQFAMVVFVSVHVFAGVGVWG